MEKSNFIGRCSNRSDIITIQKDIKHKTRRKNKKPHPKERREIVVSSEKLKIAIQSGSLKLCKNVIDLSQKYVLKKRTSDYVLIEHKTRETIAIGGTRLKQELS